jgi:hypothetical protein
MMADMKTSSSVAEVNLASVKLPEGQKDAAQFGECALEFSRSEHDALSQMKGYSAAL